MPNNNLLSGGLRAPRSAAEEYEFQFGDLISRHRQLPCKSFIIAGTCPYRDRCDYIHDPRCFSKVAKGKTKKRNEESAILDTFYWPNLSQTYLCRPGEKFRADVVVQRYHIPEPKPDKYYRHDAALYSLWNYFVETCVQCTEGKFESTPTRVSQFTKNKFTGRSRLPIFVNLAHTNTLGQPNSSGMDNKDLIPMNKSLDSFVSRANNVDRSVVGEPNILQAPIEFISRKSFDSDSSSLSSETFKDNVFDVSPHIPGPLSGVHTPTSDGSASDQNYYYPDDMYGNMHHGFVGGFRGFSLYGEAAAIYR